ncbi:MAG: hypothetical protein ACRD1C_08320 [Terriglobales bacterium]
MKPLRFFTVLLSAAAIPLLAVAQRPAQRPARPATPARQTRPAARPAPNRGPAKGVGGGYVPQHGPEPLSKKPALPEKNRVSGHPTAPHVHAQGDVWVGRIPSNGVRYHLDHPWEHGHFPGRIGASQIWRLEGGGPNRFYFGGYVFMVAAPDVHYCSNWLWNSDDIVLYDDPMQVGWYVAYDVRLGTWCHVQFLGQA